MGCAIHSFIHLPIYRSHRRFGVRAVGLWAACYAIVLAVGVTRQTQSTGFWIVAAVFTAVPLVVAALIPAPKAADVS